jgi:hypothetical protein
LPSIAPIPKVALAKSGNVDWGKAFRTTSGLKPTPVTDLLPVALGACQLTTFADTLDPPIAMKSTTTR